MKLTAPHPGSDVALETPLRFLHASGARPLEGYTIKRGIGRGGFGEVYYATSDAGKDVALKLIRRNLDIELRGVQQCLNLKHPNLLGLFDIRQDETGESWVVMEYVAGDGLEAVLARHLDGLPPAEALDWFLGLGAAVAYLHDRGIVHRDLKPGNVFRDEGIVKLGDYGLSKFISVSRRSGQTESVGTVHYMAPEIAKGRYGKEIDIYALGILLYELLTGHVPFEGESVGEVLMKHLTAEPDLGRVAEPYRSAIAACLEKDPERRVQSVGELLAMLPGESAAATGRQPAAATPANHAGAVPHRTPQAQVRPAGGYEDPMLASLRKFARDVDRWWKGYNFSVPAKLGILGLIVWALWANSGSLTAFGGLMAVLGVTYWAYARLVAEDAPVREMPARHRDAFIATPPAAPPREPPPVSRVAYAQPPRGGRREPPMPALIVKPTRERIIDLSGSMLVAAGVSAALGVIMVLLRGATFQPEQYAWLVLTSTLGSWFVLAPAKLWEGTRGDTSLRRFGLMLLGLGLGAVTWGLDRYLWVDLSYEMLTTAGAGKSLGHSFYDPQGQPQLFAYLAYFGFLFLLPRWWRQADPLRSTRVSLWSTGVCVVVAMALNLIWPFPQPWGLMAAATTSLAVQLSSPWQDKRLLKVRRQS